MPLAGVLANAEETSHFVAGYPPIADLIFRMRNHAHNTGREEVNPIASLTGFRRRLIVLF